MSEEGTEPCTKKTKIDKEPGAAPFGNFINYYQFNPPIRRTSFVPPQLLEYIRKETHGENAAGPTFLDVGCNAGDLTVALYNHFRDGGSEGSTDSPASIQGFGVDLDPQLIERAQALAKSVDALQFSTLDVMKEDETGHLLDAFLAGSETKGPPGTSGAPHRKFDVVFAFSITMWVHLHHGDEGLWRFLAVLASRTDTFVVEPQPWKCYTSARVRLRKLGRPVPPHYSTIKVRNDVLEQTQKFLSEGSPAMPFSVQLGETAWGRPVMLYTRHRSVRDAVAGWMASQKEEQGGEASPAPGNSDADGKKDAGGDGKQHAGGDGKQDAGGD